MRMLIFIVLAFAGLNGAADADPSVFRIGYLATSTSPCRAIDASSQPGLRAYARHLSVRLSRNVRGCAFASTEEASAALAEGLVDLAPLSADASAQRGDVIRPLLTPRAAGGVGRVLTLLVIKTGAPFENLSKVAGARMVLGGSSEVARAGPLRALADNGAPSNSFRSETVAASPAAAVEALRAGKADMMLIHAAAWQRLCRGDGPRETPCADLQEVWRGRPNVDSALAVRRDMADELRLRIVGIHVAMHLEAPEAFRWIAPGAGELQPIEASARVRAPVRP
jgi:ABC-type phosphate/phosphonate transport system substrate-binding protein